MTPALRLRYSFSGFFFSSVKCKPSNSSDVIIFRLLFLILVTDLHMLLNANDKN